MFQGARERDNQMIPLTEFAFRNAAGRCNFSGVHPLTLQLLLKRLEKVILCGSDCNVSGGRFFK